MALVNNQPKNGIFHQDTFLDKTTSMFSYFSKQDMLWYIFDSPKCNNSNEYLEGRFSWRKQKLYLK